MKKIFLLLNLGLLACNGSNLTSGKTYVEVNGEKITEGHLEFLSGMNPGIARQIATPFGKRQILDNLVEQELLYQAAKREGIHRDPNTQAKVDLYAKVIVAQAYVEAEAEKEARKHYDANSAEFEQVGLAHILIKFGKERKEAAALKLANSLYEKLQKGEKFEALAKASSEDTMTKDQGGDFGKISRNDPRLARRGFAPLLEKAFEMKVAEVAGPVKTTAGYHLLTVTAPREVVPFEEVRMPLVFRKGREIRDQLLARLKEKGKITYAEELKAAEPTEAPAETPPHPPHEGHDDHSHPQPTPAQSGTGGGKR